MEVDLVAPFVNHHLVVKPAEHYELVLVRLATFRPCGEVVDLEPVSRDAPVGPAHVVVPGEHSPPQPGWCRALLAPVLHVPPVLGAGDDLCFGVAQDGLQGFTTYARS